MNKYIPGRTDKEWYDDNLENIKEQRKEYRIKNNEKLKIKNKLYYENNSEDIKEYHKNYNIKNKDIIKQKRDEYR